MNLIKFFESFINSIEKNEETKWMKILDDQSNENFIIFKLDKLSLKNNGFENFYNFLKQIKNRRRPGCYNRLYWGPHY